MVILTKLVLFLLIVDIWYLDVRMLEVLNIFTNLEIIESEYKTLNSTLNLVYIGVVALVISKMNLSFLFKE